MAKITPWTKIKAEYLAGVTPKDLSQKNDPETKDADKVSAWGLLI